MKDERMVSGNDYSGTSDDPRDCRHVEPSQNARGIAEAHDEGLQAERCDAGIGELSEEIASQIVADTETQIEAHVAVATSGPIPDPATLAAYPPEIQDKIIEWHDRQIKAVFDDASKRDTYIAKEDVRLDRLKQWLSFAINLVLIGGALVAFVVTGNANVFWSYTVLGATVIGNVAININKNKKRDD